LRKATLRLLGRKRAGSISFSSGRTAAPIATSKGVYGSAWKNPALPIRAGSACSGATRWPSQSGARRVPASVAAMISPRAAWIAMLRPCEMFAPGCSSTVSGRRAVASRRIAGVPSVEPPSTITISSGAGSSRASDSSTARIESPSLKTVMISETEDEC